MKTGNNMKLEKKNSLLKTKGMEKELPMHNLSKNNAALPKAIENFNKAFSEYYKNFIL